MEKFSMFVNQMDAMVLEHGIGCFVSWGWSLICH